ncbi:MAG: mechanosensitive ion channel family protein [Alistipes sp.]|nr:mechanosensitive ion channel family protein [Alistipes sp.]
MQKIISRWVDSLLVGLGFTETQADGVDQWIILGIICVIAMAVDLVCRTVLLKVVNRIVRRTKAHWDDIVFDSKVLRRFCNIITPLLLHAMLPAAFPEDSPVLSLILRILQIYIVLTVLRFINTLLEAIFEAAENLDQWQGKPLKGLMQTGQVAAIIVGAILIISILIDKSPTILLTGLGASAAVMMLIFKDSILGLVAGVQLSANNMLKVGDWIAMPKYGVDGMVTEVALTIVKVRNWDNTIVTLPPYVLISDSFQNWQAMRDSGGRRVKRSISIDMSTVGFCTSEQIERFARTGLLHDYVTQTGERIDSFNQANGVTPETRDLDGMRMTNLGALRNYIMAYLRRRDDVNKSMLLNVRQLQPTEHGIPLELYFFTSAVDWMTYERIQSEVFDHVLAVVPLFGLRVFQRPTGEDLRLVRNDAIR